MNKQNLNELNIGLTSKYGHIKNSRIFSFLYNREKMSERKLSKFDKIRIQTLNELNNNKAQRILKKTNLNKLCNKTISNIKSPKQSENEKNKNKIYISEDKKRKDFIEKFRRVYALTTNSNFYNTNLFIKDDIEYYLNKLKEDNFEKEKVKIKLEIKKKLKEDFYQRQRNYIYDSSLSYLSFVKEKNKIIEGRCTNIETIKSLNTKPQYSPLRKYNKKINSLNRPTRNNKTNNYPNTNTNQNSPAHIIKFNKFAYSTQPKGNFFYSFNKNINGLNSLKTIKLDVSFISPKIIKKKNLFAKIFNLKKLEYNFVSRNQNSRISPNIINYKFNNNPNSIDNYKRKSNYSYYDKNNDIWNRELEKYNFLLQQKEFGDFSYHSIPKEKLESKMKSLKMKYNLVQMK